MTLVTKSIESMLEVLDSHVRRIATHDEACVKSLRLRIEETKASVNSARHEIQNTKIVDIDVAAAERTSQADGGAVGKVTAAATSPEEDTKDEPTKDDEQEEPEMIIKARRSVRSLSEMEIGIEVEEVKVRDVHGWMLNPNWTSKMTWDMVVMSVVLFDACVLPFQLSFKHGRKADSFDNVWFYITTILFFTDIFTTFITAIVDEQDEGLIVDRRKIVRTYLKSWFVLDFVSTVPWSRIVEAAVDGSGGPLKHIAKLAKVLKFLRIVRLMKMLRAKKIKDLWEKLEVRIGSAAIVQTLMLIRIIMILLGICHWNACLFWMVGSPRSIITDFLPQSVVDDFAKLPHWTTNPRTYGPGQEMWTYFERSISEQYVFCFYWTLGVMRTMPAEVSPVNLAERIFVLCFMFFALSVFAVSVASLTQAFFKISDRSRTFNDEMFALRLHLHKLGVEDTTQRRIKDYITHLWQNRRFQAKEIALLDKLPTQLSQEVKSARVQKYVETLQCMVYFSAQTLKQVCLMAEPKDIMPDITLCSAGDEAKRAVLLVAGELHVKDRHGRSMHVKSHSVIDETCLLAETIVMSEFTVKTVSTCEVIVIDKIKFAEVASRELRGLSPQISISAGAWSTEVVRHIEDDDDDDNDQSSAAVAALAAG